MLIDTFRLVKSRSANQGFTTKPEGGSGLPAFVGQ